MKARLVFGCHGSRRYGFNLCRGVQNPILELDKLGAQKVEAVEYFDNHFKLFDKVAEDKNQINSIVNYIDAHKLIPPHMVGLLYEFMTIHKACGLFCYLETINDE